MRGIITIILAWRNVWRNKRRTILTLLTILVGCAMIIFLNAFAKGGHDQMIEDAVSANIGHIQIHEKGFWNNRTIDYAVKPSQKMKEFLSEDDRIAGYSYRIHSAGLLSYKGSTAGAVIQGADPEKEMNVSSIHEKILPGGRYLNKNDRDQILLGETLARNLGAKVGSTIAMISQGFDGSIAARKLTIVGLFRTGNAEYDNMLLIMPFKQAADTFTMRGYVNSIVIKLKDTSYTENVKNDLRSISPEKDLEIMGWGELMPELVQFIVMDNISAYIFDFILFMVVAFGVLNTIQMSVFERTREIGIMLSIGTRPGQIVKMILFESVFISVSGIILGVAAGYALSYYFNINPFNYSQYAKEMEVWGISTVLFPADATVTNLSVTALITFLLSILFTAFPARRASRLKPVEAIRHL
jgi:putative ABC transport system permease protein